MLLLIGLAPMQGVFVSLISYTECPGYSSHILITCTFTFLAWFVAIRMYKAHAISVLALTQER